MKIRISGTAAECEAAVRAVETVLEVADVSVSHVSRGHADLRQLCLDVHPRLPRAERALELSSAAARLVESIEHVHRELKAVDHRPLQHASSRLVEAADQLHGVRRDLDATAADLTRIAAYPVGVCQAEWGACPQHGNTLASSGRRSWCHRCGQQWEYDRLGLPCDEPAEYLLRDCSGTESRVCEAHAADARDRLLGVEITPLPTGERP